MLNREKCARDICARISKLFPDLTIEDDLAQRTWQQISTDGSFPPRVQAAESSFLVPTWEGNLADVFEVPTVRPSHTVIAVDGSQIYPDRHVAGAGCFLLNAGGVILRYGQISSATFFSEPHVLVPEDIMPNSNRTPFSKDLVDLKREESELELLCEKAIEYQQENPTCLCDGSIIFWQLNAKEPDVKKFFLDRYLFYLEKLYQKQILIAGYISLPKSRELVSLIKLGLCRFSIADCIGCHREYQTFPCQQVDALLDTHVARFFLKERQRTTVFYSTSSIVEDYPEHLHPAFVYCNVGSEIVRLEMPAWVAADQKKIDTVCAVALDQSIKGKGYPVCLAESHEQAVVKGGDRDFFYHILCKIGMDQHKRVSLSQKAMKKRGIGI